MHRKHIRRWHKLFAASASLIAILAGVLMAPARANSAPAVNMFWADVSRTNQSTLTFYLMTNVTIKNLEASDFYVFGSATGCVVDDNFSQSSFHVVTVRGCSDGNVAVQLGANSVSDLSIAWGPAEGVASDFTTVDRTSPDFSFDPTLTVSTDSSFNIRAAASEQVELVDALLSPTVSGNSCSLSGVSIDINKYVFAISQCAIGAEAQVRIYANSYKDATGNLGPAQNIVSQVVKVQATPAPAPLPTSTSTPAPSPSVTASPAPTASPTPEATLVAVAQPPLEPPADPAPAVPTEVVTPEAEAVVPMAPIASIRAIESATSSTPVDPPTRPRAVSATQPEPIQPETLTNPLPAPRTEVSAAPEPPLQTTASEPVVNFGWVVPAASVASIALGAVAGAFLVRSRLARKPRLRVA